MIFFIVRSQLCEFHQHEFAFCERRIFFSTNPAYLSEMAEARFPFLSVSPPGGLTKMAIDERMARPVHLNALEAGWRPLPSRRVSPVAVFRGGVWEKPAVGRFTDSVLWLISPRIHFFLFRVRSPANIYYVLATDQQVCVGGGCIFNLAFFVHTPAVLISPPHNPRLE